MNDELAHKRLTEVLALIDAWGDLYNRRWGKKSLAYLEDDRLAPMVDAQIDEVRARSRLARDVIAAMGESAISKRVAEHEEGQFGGHPFTQARIAIVEAIAILTQREELAEIVGPIGPRLSATELHATIWGSAAKLWDDGHPRAAVQTGATALEGLLQAMTGPSVSGEGLAVLFSIGEPTADSPRARLRGVEPDSKTWKSAHEGSAALVRGAFLAIRNLVSHPGWPDPSPSEALEMLAVLSYVARLLDRTDLVRCEAASETAAKPKSRRNGTGSGRTPPPPE